MHLMVATRSSNSRSKPMKKEAEAGTFKFEAVIPTAEPPKKRQKKTKESRAAIQPAAIKVAGEALSPPIPEVLNTEPVGGRSKKLKKLQQTLISDKDLPAIRRKAAKVQHSFMTKRLSLSSVPEAPGGSSKDPLAKLEYQEQTLNSITFRTSAFGS